MNLLEMALDQAKDQWCSGEVVQIHSRVYLKNSGGFVTLNLLGYPETMTIFWLNPATSIWEMARDVHAHYSDWSHNARQFVEQHKDGSQPRTLYRTMPCGVRITATVSGSKGSHWREALAHLRGAQNLHAMTCGICAIYVQTTRRVVSTRKETR